MSRRATITVVVLAVVLLAGCSAILGGDTGTGVGDDPADFEYPDGFSADGVEEGAVSAYEAALLSSGSFTGDYQYVVKTDEGETQVDVDYVVDFNSEQGLQRVTVDSPDDDAMNEAYYEGGQLYQRSEYNDQQSGVAVEEKRFPPTELTASEAIRPLLTNATGYDVSLAERDGEPIAVYETDDVTAAEKFLGVDDTENVSAFEASFGVDQRGIVRTAEYEITYLYNGQERTVIMEFEISAVGETTVERPAWADEA